MVSKDLKKSNMMKEFGALVLTIFAEPLAHYGFKKEHKKTERYFCEIMFENGKRYVELHANIHPRDYPPYFNVVLGEGGRDFLETDWNSMALWRLKNHFLGTNRGGEYSLKQSDKLLKLLLKARDDLFQFGEPFLSGNMELFRNLRAEQNKNREPYKIHELDKNGKYITRDEPGSVKMKKKYSQIIA